MAPQPHQLSAVSLWRQRCYDITCAHRITFVSESDVLVSWERVYLDVLVYVWIWTPVWAIEVVRDLRFGSDLGRHSRGGRGRRPREGKDVRVDDLNGQGNDQVLGANGGVEGVNGNVEGVNEGVGNQGNVENQNGNVVSENIQKNVRNVLVNGNQIGCSYKEFLACNPKEYDDKGGVVVLTRWIKKTKNVQEMSGCGVDQKNHAMVRAGHVTYIDRFHELARLVPHLVTPESRKIERYVYGLAATPPKWATTENEVPGALLYDTIAQVMRERPLSVV
nr:reverse transcriptase domain-containing protein [Tanacetum cinerariifolium]